MRIVMTLGLTAVAVGCTGNSLSLSLVFCLALGLNVAAYIVANADIDKSNGEAGRVHITGRFDTS